ncbi:MAG TPA: TolC family protein [Bryobacteraceae bacterium]|nr:TolC family protein [Bryobacteraceae bacterium]
MTDFRSVSSFRSIAFTGLALAGLAFAQTDEISIQPPKPVPFLQPLLNPFHLQRREVSPANLANSQRLETLVRAGNLYLSAQDVIALALENNIDIAVQRYGPYLAREVLRRAEGGAPLRSVNQPIQPGPQSVSLNGVSVTNVSIAGGGSGVTSGGGLVASIGTNPPSLDPYLLAYGLFSHNTTPLSNEALALVNSQVVATRTYELQYGQSWPTGTSATFTFLSSHIMENSPAYSLNPFTQGDLDFYITQNLMQGWGVGSNTRYIKVAKNNIKVSDLNLKLQVITTVSAILNLYWDLVSFDDDLRIKQQALETAQQLYEDNKHQAELGTLPSIEVTRAEAQVSQSKEDLLISQTNVAQQETILKNALSRNGAVNGWLDEVHIVPLDNIVVPEKEDLKPLPALMEEALADRAELEQARINVESQKIQTKGTRNALLPTLQAFAELTNNGLTGSPNVRGLAPGIPPPDSYVVGGYGNLLGEIFRRNYPNYSAGFSLNIPFRNRAPQADYVADQITLRQYELQLQKAINDIRQQVKNSVIGLQQARARYETAVATRKLQQQTLDAEQMRFKFGESTIANVVQAQRDLATDQSAEVTSMANYTHAQIAFEQAIGATLDVHNISIEEARTGKVARQSSIPDTVPQGN